MSKLFDGRPHLSRRAAVEVGLSDGEAPSYKTYIKFALTYATQIDEPFDVDTIEGTMHGQAGDYLAIGIHGERYPIAKAVFEASYEVWEA